MRLRHRMARDRRVAAGDEMFELTFDVAEKGAGADAEEVCLQPFAPKLLFHQDQPVEGVLGRTYAAGRLEADFEAGQREIVADRPAHEDAHPARRNDVLLYCGGLSG